MQNRIMVSRHMSFLQLMIIYLGCLFVFSFAFHFAGLPFSAVVLYGVVSTLCTLTPIDWNVFIPSLKTWWTTK